MNLGVTAWSVTAPDGESSSALHRHAGFKQHLFQHSVSKVLEVLKREMKAGPASNPSPDVRTPQPAEGSSDAALAAERKTLEVEKAQLAVERAEAARIKAEVCVCAFVRAAFMRGDV